jgi:outer membrane protein W
MNSKFSSSLAFIAVASCLAITASAAMAGPNTNTPWRVQAGGFFPSNGTIRNLTDNTQLDAGFSYDIQKSQSNPYGIYANIDTVKKHGYTLSAVAVGLDVRNYLSNAKNDVQPYIGLGVGGYNIYSDTSSSHNDLKFGGKVSVGIESKQGVYLEAGYTGIAKAHLVGQAKTLDPGGVSVDLGYKF